MAGRKSSVWSRAELEYLRENYIELSLDQMITELFKIRGTLFTKAQISNKKRDLGLFTYLDKHGFIIKPNKIYTFNTNKRRAAFSYGEVTVGKQTYYLGCLLVPPYKFFAAASFAALIGDVTAYYRKYAKRKNARFITDQDWDWHHPVRSTR